MAAPRISSVRALKHLSAGRQVRQLHITGPATLPGSALTAERKLTQKREASPVRAESRRRTTLEQNEHHDSHRGFGTAALDSQARPRGHVSGSGIPSPNYNPQRHINTSRALKAVNDSSTIDFTYLPDAAIAEAAVVEPAIPVPLAPDTFARNPQFLPKPEPEFLNVHIPLVSTSSADVHFSTFADTHDNPSAANIDFTIFAARAASPGAAAPKRRSSLSSSPATTDAPSSNTGGAVGEVWRGFLDDVFGSKSKPASGAA